MDDHKGIGIIKKIVLMWIRFRKRKIRGLVKKQINLFLTAE